MYLKSIELSGFKSFAKKSELKFTSTISAIVGPNGSGKSNIAEAFRFVLGEQSIKSLRGKKGEDLIFNGAGDLPKANRASVKVIFDNSKKFLPVDFEEVIIERVVHRDSVNEYLINGSQVRLKDIVELLASAHIGSTGHHIISQGEADRILNASIKERKSMIEEALGLRAYQYKKQESERKLEKTKENIKQVESLRREIMPHIKFLKKQVEKIEKSLELKKELQEKAIEYLHREDDYINKTKDRLEAERKPLEVEMQKLEKELSEARAVLEKSKHKDEKSEELMALEKDLHNIREEKDNLFREFGRLDGELASLVRMVKKQEEVANTQASKMVSLVSVENLSRDIEIKIKEARSVMEEAIESRDSAKVISVLNQITNLFSNFLDHNRDKIDNSLIIDAQKDIEDLKASKKELERKLEDIKKKETELNHKYSELKTNIEKEKDSNRDAEKAVFRIMSEEQELRSKIHTLEAEEENLRLLKENFKREITELGMLVGTHVLQFAKLPEGVTFEYESDRKPQEDRRRVIEKIKIRLEEAGAGFSGEDVMKEFKDATERDEFLARELLDLDNSAKSLTDLIQDLDEKLSTEFKTGVEKINTQFKEYFALMFGGGTAELSVIAAPKRKKEDKGDREAQAILSDTYSEGSLQENPEESEGLDSGIDIDVSLPKKKVKGLMMLSGGERALTSIALLFAISQVNPPPFIILDETDAALDEANSKKYGDMIENLAKFSQLIVITHNRETMSRAGILYGVTMGLGGGSKLLSVAFDEAVAVAK